MSKKLTEKQIRSILAENKEKNISYSYKDSLDANIDVVVKLYEEKKIDDKLLMAAISLFISTSLKETVSNLSKQMIEDSINHNKRKSNKLFFLSYSNEKYA